MICFDNAQQDYKEAVTYSKEQVLFAYTKEIVQTQNINDKDCSSFELDPDQVQLMMDDTAAFLSWMKKPAENISNQEVTHMGWGSAAHTRTMKMAPLRDAFSQSSQRDYLCQEIAPSQRIAIGIHAIWHDETIRVYRGPMFQES